MWSDVAAATGGGGVRSVRKECGWYAGSSWDELKHIRQAVGFLVIHQKFRISYDEITNDLCPVLSVQQLYRICTLYWDDNYNTRSVSPDVISSMRVLMTEDSNNAVGNSFLLDDSSRFVVLGDDGRRLALEEGRAGVVRRRPLYGVAEEKVWSAAGRRGSRRGRTAGAGEGGRRALFSGGQRCSA
ncbi:hypothetical protein KSS87_002670, partial [Heliosperma pusillum]